MVSPIFNSNFRISNFHDQIIFKREKPTTYNEICPHWLNFFRKKSGFVICNIIIWECVLSQELYFFMVRTYSLSGTILLFISKWLLPFFTQELYFSKRIGDWRIFSMYPVLSCQYCQLQFLKGPLNFASNNDLEKKTSMQKMQ